VELKMTHLYKLSEQYRDLIVSLSDNEELTEETLKIKLQDVTTELNEKAEILVKLF
jgi:hypothetical protein